MAPTPVTTEEKIADMDKRLTLIEEKVTVIDAKVDTRFDEVMTVLGVSPNPAIGTSGSGLAGSVSALLAAEQARKLSEQEREKRQQEYEKKRAWVVAFVTVAGTIVGLFNYLSNFHR